MDRTVWRVHGAPLLAPLAAGALSGELVAVKDLYAVTGQAIGVGVPEFLRGRSPEAQDAAAVRLLREAGAAIAGIACTDQFAYSLAGQNGAYGTPPNPAAPGHVPGGSSSGPASAVALGEASIGLGTDTAGSIRVPSSYQRLWGLRSSHDLIPRDGLVQLAETFDTVGCLTRDPHLLGRALAALVPSEDRVVPSIEAVVLCPTLTALAEPFIAHRITSAARRLAAALGVPVRSWKLDPSRLHDWFTAFRTVQAWEAWRRHGPWILKHPGALATDVAGRFSVAAKIGRHEYETALATAARAGAEITDRLAETLLVMPAASSAPPRLDDTGDQVERVRFDTLHLTCLAGLGRLPVCSAPFLAEQDLKPTGPGNVAVVGGRGTDVALPGLVAGALA